MWLPHILAYPPNPFPASRILYVVDHPLLIVPAVLERRDHSEVDIGVVLQGVQNIKGVRYLRVSI